LQKKKKLKINFKKTTLFIFRTVKKKNKKKKHTKNELRKQDRKRQRQRKKKFPYALSPFT
jgi:HSP20 family molecular chaperone IbpA